MFVSQNLEFGLLPERKMDWRTLAWSYGFVVFVLFIIVNLRLIFPDRIQLRQKYTVTELIPRPDLRPKTTRQRKAKPRTVVAKLLPPPTVFHSPKLIVPRDLRVKKKKEDEEAPKVVVNTLKAPALQSVSGAMPAKLIYTGSFGNSAAPTINAPIQKVQTGGFGDPDGLKGQGKENAKLVATQIGSFDLPNGPGKGNGTGGANGLQGTVASAGFGNGIAQPGQGDGRRNGQGAVQTSSFGAQEVAQSGTKLHQVETGPPTSQVEITFKPKPVYTDEARQLKLEGEVLLEVRFGANGQLQVNRVTRGLGHGLDEAAMSAANKMRFKPAMRNGVPVDSTAIVHVVFQLAM